MGFWLILQPSSAILGFCNPAPVQLSGGFTALFQVSVPAIGLKQQEQEQDQDPRAQPGSSTVSDFGIPWILTRPSSYIQPGTAMIHHSNRR